MSAGRVIRQGGADSGDLEAEATKIRRAVDDPARLSRAACIIRAALARQGMALDCRPDGGDADAA